MKGAVGRLRSGFWRRLFFWKSRAGLWGIASWLLSIVSGAAAVALANFGAPAWIFVVLGLWLWTLGLPTLLSVLLVVFVWGWFPEQPAHSFAWAALTALLLSCVLQLGAARLLARFLRSRRAL